MSNGFSRDFPIDAGIFTTAKVSLVDASTDADVRDAILAVTTDTFPDRDVQLGHIAVAADTGKVSVKPEMAKGASVSFDISASAHAGGGLYAKAADAIRALDLAEPPALGAVDAAGQKFILFDWGYSVAASASLSHPIGALGSVSFGVDAKRNAMFAILHRFANTTRAHLVLDDVFASWRLPRHVAFAGGDVNIKPFTWLIAEADGSLGLKIAASLGWNVSFAKDASILGVTHNLSTKIDTSLKATFGFNVAGKYLVAVARESDQPIVRLRLFKQSSKGFNFGFNLKVGIQGADPQLPGSLDDFIKTTFGVHGLQVVNDVRAWTNDGTDLGQKLAGLANKAAIDLLKQTTGIDAQTEFERARQTLRDALKTWDSLPDRLPPMLWKLLPAAAAKDLAILQQFLVDLQDPAKGAQALAAALQKATFGETPEGRFLEAIADKGLLALADRFHDVSVIAGNVLDVLNGGIVRKLQEYVDRKLDLDQIRKAVNDADFAAVDGWLQQRLANFLDHELHLDDLKDIQKAITTLDSKAAQYYKAGVEALTKKYSLEFATTYQSTTSDTALIDVDFDLSVGAAAVLFTDVVAESALDKLLTADTAGATLRQAKLTHDIKRQGTVDIHLPRFDFTQTHVNDAIATLTAEEQAGRVLVYGVSAKDSVTAASRASSQLSVLASLRVTGGVPELDESTGSIGYEMRQVKADMRPLDLEARTAGFIHQYLAGLFAGGDTSIRSFYTDLDIALTASTHSQSNHLGDMAASMQLSLPASALAVWFTSRDAARVRRDAMDLSRALQLSFRRQVPALYFTDLNRYGRVAPVSALLVWSSMPASTNATFDGTTLQLNTDTDTFWDWRDRDLRRAFARDGHTLARLGGRLDGIRTELREAGHGNADDFSPSKAPQIAEEAIDAAGDQFLSSLLFTEAELVDGARDALDNVSRALANAGSAPTRAIDALARFAGALTETFNARVQTIYSGVSGRAIGPMLLVESSAALGGAGAAPRAMLSLAALNPGHSFDLGTFIDGKTPPAAEIALTQTLVSTQ